MPPLFDVASAVASAVADFTMALAGACDVVKVVVALAPWQKTWRPPLSPPITAASPVVFPVPVLTMAFAVTGFVVG